MEGNGGLESAVEEANEQETCASGLGEEFSSSVYSKITSIVKPEEVVETIEKQKKQIRF